MEPESEHRSVVIERPAAVVYEYAADPANLPRWAAGLAGSAPRRAQDGWVVDSPMGRVGVEFAERNDFGVLDHVVTLPSGERVYNPMRVLPHGEHCEVLLTVRHRANMSAGDLARDAAAVATDLETLKRVLEA